MFLLTQPYIKDSVTPWKLQTAVCTTFFAVLSVLIVGTMLRSYIVTDAIWSIPVLTRSIGLGTWALYRPELTGNHLRRAVIFTCFGYILLIFSGLLFVLAMVLKHNMPSPWIFLCQCGSCILMSLWVPTKTFAHWLKTRLEPRLGWKSTGFELQSRENLAVHDSSHDIRNV